MTTTSDSLILHGLDRVATFVSVVEVESFTAAAQALGLPKSSVSRNVSRLEQDLGVRLLHRTTRRLRLTEAGSAFYQKARGALAALEEAALAAADHSLEPRGTVRLTAPPDLGEFLAAPIASFLGEHPQIQVDLVLTARLVDLVREGFDLALRASTSLPDSSLVARKLGSFAEGLYAAPAYLKRHGVPSTPAELGHHQCVLFRVRGHRTTWTMRGPAGDEQVAVHGACAVDDLSFVIHAAEAGAGIAYLPHVLAARSLAAKRLVRVLPEYSQSHAELSLILPSGRHIPARVTLLRDFLQDSLRAVLRPKT